MSQFFTAECAISWISKVILELGKQSRDAVWLRRGVEMEYMMKLREELGKFVICLDTLSGLTESPAAALLCPWGAQGFWYKLRKVELKHLQFS